MPQDRPTPAERDAGPRAAGLRSVFDLGELRERVDVAADRRARWRRLRLSRERLQPRIERDRRLLDDRQREYAAAQAEVDRLEGRSVARFLATVNGALDERLREARAEVGQAQERIAEIRARLATLALDADRLDGDIALLGEPGTAYREALADLLLAARVSSDPTAAEQVAEVERRQRAMVQKVDIEAVIPFAEELVTATERMAERIRLTTDEWSGSTPYGTEEEHLGPYGPVYHADPLGFLRREVAGVQETLDTLREELASSALPAVELPDLDGFPSTGIRLKEPLLHVDMLDRMAATATWADDRVAASRRALAALEQVRRDLADA